MPHQAKSDLEPLAKEFEAYCFKLKLVAMKKHIDLSKIKIICKDGRCDEDKKIKARAKAMFYN